MRKVFLTFLLRATEQIFLICTLNIRLLLWFSKLKSNFYCMKLSNMKRVRSVSYESSKFHRRTLRFMKRVKRRAFHILS